MCILSFKSITAAQNAKSALLSAGITSSVISIDPNITKRGCSYGLSFSSNDKEHVLSILKRKRITYGEVYG